MNTDKIILAGMEFYGKHGVFPEEKVLGQKFIVDAEICLDLKHAGRTDDIFKTHSYAEIYELIKVIVTEKSFNLIEAVAEEIAGQILRKYKVESVKIRIRKPNAPINGTFEYMGCEIVRERDIAERSEIR